MEKHRNGHPNSFGSSGISVGQVLAFWSVTACGFVDDIPVNHSPTNFWYSENEWRWRTTFIHIINMLRPKHDYRHPQISPRRHSLVRPQWNWSPIFFGLNGGKVNFSFHIGSSAVSVRGEPLNFTLPIPEYCNHLWSNQLLILVHCCSIKGQ